MPYICLMCNDSLLYTDNTVNLENPEVSYSQSEIIDQDTSVANTQDNQSNVSIIINTPDSESIGNQSTICETINAGKNNGEGSHEKFDRVGFDKDPNKKPKRKKSNYSNSKTSVGSENQETLIAQKYVSSLEGRVNDLDNMVKILQKTIENQNSNQQQFNVSEHFQKSCWRLGFICWKAKIKC